MTNEVAKMNDGVVVVQDPFSPEKYHPAANVDGMIDSAFAHLAYRREQFDALGNIDEAPLSAVKTMCRAIEDDDKALQTFDKRMREALLDLSGFRPYIVQTKGAGARIDAMSVRGKLAEMLKVLKARIAAETPPQPTHTYVFQADVTDDDFKKVTALLAKIGVPYRYVCLDNRDAKADRFFEANGWKAQ